MKPALLFIVFWSVCEAKGRGRGNEFSFLNFAPLLQNQILVDVGGNLSQTGAPDDIACSFECLKHVQCTSYNFGPVGDPLQARCGLLNVTRFHRSASLQSKAGFVHGSLSTPCETAPCLNGGQCTPLYETGSRACDCTTTGFIGDRCERADCGVVFDFESGLDGWQRTGSAFDNQPTFGDNSKAREAAPSNHVGDWWIGTYEHRPTSGSPAGHAQGDGPVGTLTSPPFEIKSDTLSHRVGGSANQGDARVELLVDGAVVYTAVSGQFTETMEEQQWDVRAYRGKTAQLKLVDASSGGWGHVNFDHLAYTCS